METILLLGGRAPATLELARLFYRAGHRVVAAESAPVSITAVSGAVERAYRLPPPAQDLAGFARALASVIEQEQVSYLLATCEEIFHVARARTQLPESCRVFAPPLSELWAVHHKGRFIDMARGFSLAVPETATVCSPDELAPFLARSREHVFKPVYSRFAARTLIRPAPGQVLKQVKPTPEQPWVVQPFLDGRQICTYSVAHGGRLTAHCAYPTEWTAGQGATVAFRSIEHAASRAWVERFVEAVKWSGQIAFDFIERPGGTVVALECNPRATSGVHLLASDPAFAAAFFEEDRACVAPAKGATAMVGAGMVVYGLPAIRSRPKWRAWREAMRGSRDVIWRRDDPKPWLWQWLALAAFVWRGARLGITPLEASTWDIEWNGE